MAQRNVRNWLKGKINESLTQVPVSPTYPYSACKGILYSLGFPQSLVEVYSNRIVTELDIDSQAAIMIHIPTSTQTQKTGQGAYAILVVSHKIELDVFWYANIDGEYDSVGNQIESPTFTNQIESDIVFDRFLKGIEKTISLSVYRYESFDTIGSGGSQPMFDTSSPDNELTVINAIQPVITLASRGAARLEDSKNLVYQATLYFELVETYATATKAT